MLLKFATCLPRPLLPLQLSGFSDNVPVGIPCFPSWGRPWRKAGKPVLEQEKKFTNLYSGLTVSFKEHASMIAVAILYATCCVGELAVNEGPLCFGPQHNMET